jgi:hypothetical protein
MASRLSPRFGFAATLLVLVAVLAILLELGRTTALVALFATWVAVAALELVAARRTVEPPVDAEAPPDDARPVAGAEPFVPRLVAAAEPAGEPEPLSASPFDEAAPETSREELLSTVAPLSPEPPPDEERAG